jgi:hypothetical protein
MDVPAKSLSERRREYILAIEDRLILHCKAPWTNYIEDLILHKYMWALGIRIADIDRLIQKELNKQIPA